VESKATGGAPIPQGSVGVIVCVPVDSSHSYRVRFADGSEASFRRAAITILKQLQKDSREPADPAPLLDYVIYRCVVGSRAYGLDDEQSDTDYRGIYLPPSDLHWALGGVPGQLERVETEECYWELEKFLVLALKANPNILECLYTPLVTLTTPLADELLGMKSVFLSRLLFQTYNGYVLSQFKKLERDLRQQQTLKWKHVMHLIRLLLSGIAALQEGAIPVRIGKNRDRLLAIRQGEVEWAAVNQWRLSLHKEFEQAYASTPLPERPDYQRANAFLLKARRSMVTL
jgi:predicted nucleotidyltransferase